MADEPERFAYPALLPRLVGASMDEFARAYESPEPGQRIAAFRKARKAKS